MEIVSLVCGILSLSTELMLGTQYGVISGLSFSLGEMDPIAIIVGLIAIVGIVFGIISIKKNLPKKTMAKAGLILSIIALALDILITTACSICYSKVFDAIF